MKVATYAVLGHMVLAGLLWLLGNMDTAPWCTYTCASVSYFSAFAFLLIVYPGLTIVELFGTRAPGESASAAHWIAAAVGTEFFLFFVALAIADGVMNARNKA